MAQVQEFLGLNRSTNRDSGDRNPILNPNHGGSNPDQQEFSRALAQERRAQVDTRPQSDAPAPDTSRKQFERQPLMSQLPIDRSETD